jgi:hypothetical protein
LAATGLIFFMSIVLALLSSDFRTSVAAGHVQSQEG